MAKTIAILQNEKRALDLLAASSWLYFIAKLCVGLQFVLSVVGAVTFAIVIKEYPEWKVWTTFASIAVGLLDAIILEPFQSRYKQLGAKTQELFDCELLQMPWNDILLGAKPESERVNHARDHFRWWNPKMKGKLGWYPKVVSSLKLPYARLICQRANSWWDRENRYKYGTALWLLLVLTIGAVLFIGLHGHLLFEDMVLTLVAPLAPALLWFTREIRKQRNATESLTRRLASQERFWTQAMEGQLTSVDLEQGARSFQDSLYTGRSSNPMVFDWFNAIFKKRHQRTTDEKAAELVDEALSRLGDSAKADK